MHPTRPVSTSQCSPGGQVCTPKENAFANNLFSLQVARQLQPSVVWIGDTEKIFYKKVPQAEKAVSAFLIWLFPCS